MVFLATTRRALGDYIAMNTEGSLWISASLAAEDQVACLRSAGKNVTTFSHEIRSDDKESLADAVATIREHHPDESIWVELICTS